jgi:C1A family cysteine protease
MKKQTETKKNEKYPWILNCDPSRNQENDWLFQNAEEAELFDSSAAIPPTKDLRDDTWWKIGDQDGTGSCVGWATTDSVVRWYLVNANKISKNQRLSVRYVWMASKEIDEFVNPATTFIEGSGTSLKAALDVARKYGVVLENLLPFLPIVLSHLSTESFYAQASNLKISSYYSLRLVPAPIPVTVIWKNWIATKGPILTRLGVDKTWDNATNTQGKLDTYYPDTIRGGHAVAMVGYTQDRFIIRNSWGTGWGDKGYAYASMKYAMAAFTEAYGVLV